MHIIQIIIIPLLIAIIGGILPTIFWLRFWLHEDRKKPEPTWIIVRTFIYGMVAVGIIYYPICWFSDKITQGSSTYKILSDNFEYGLLIIISLVIIEEVVKYLVAFFSGFNSKEYDEPLDSIVYMITAALGFSAMENVLSLLNSNSVVESLITINSRFIGATLLHIASSAVLGIFLALSFYKSRFFKGVYLIAGLVCSIALHAFFNLLIIKENNSVFSAFMLVWIAIFAILIILEKIKKLKRQNY